MPLAFHEHKLTGGILELGRRHCPAFGAARGCMSAVAVILGRRWRRQGRRALLCRPFWIDVFISEPSPTVPDELVASTHEAPVIASLLDLRDRPVGTVAGYRCSASSRCWACALAPRDSPPWKRTCNHDRRSAAHCAQPRNLAVSAKTQQVAPSCAPTWCWRRFRPSAPFSKRGKVPFGEVDQAISTR
jgi:hypothetical protein